jgi:hypothetical protein
MKKLTIAQLLSINSITKDGLGNELTESMALHYNNGHVWAEVPCVRGANYHNKLLRIYQDETGYIVRFLDTDESYPIDWIPRSMIIYVHPNDGFIYAYDRGKIYEYQRISGRYQSKLMNSEIYDSHQSTIVDHYLCIKEKDDDIFYCRIINLLTRTIHILPYQRDFDTVMLYELFSHHLDSNHQVIPGGAEYIYHHNCIISRKDILNDRLTYFLDGVKYSNKIINHNMFVSTGLMKVCKKRLIFALEGYDKKPDTLHVLNISLTSYNFIQPDSYIISQGIKLPVNKEKLRSIPMYERKVSYQGYEDELILDYHPESVAVFIDLLHYNMTTDNEMYIMIDLLSICDYVGCDKLKDIVYDDIYYACLKDVNKFVEVMDAQLEDPTIDQIMSDICLIHYQKVDVDHKILRKALADLYDYDSHYKLRTSNRKHHFTKKNSLPWLGE